MNFEQKADSALLSLAKVSYMYLASITDKMRCSLSPRHHTTPQFVDPLTKPRNAIESVGRRSGDQTHGHINS